MPMFAFGADDNNSHGIPSSFSEGDVQHLLRTVISCNGTPLRGGRGTDDNNDG